MLSSGGRSKGFNWNKVNETNPVQRGNTERHAEYKTCFKSAYL